MKYIKLLLMMAAFGGLIYAALSLLGTNGGGGRINPDSPTLLSDLQDRVNNDWDNASEWNQNVFDKNISDANVYKTDLERIAEGNYSILKNYTNEKICNKLVEFINTEFAKTNCSKEKIDDLQKALDYFVNKNGTIDKTDQRVSDKYSQIKLYRDILRFGKNTFRLRPQFKIDLNLDSVVWGWQDFNNHKELTTNKKNRYKKNPYYSSISHIQDVQKSLESVDEKLSEARNKFAKQLSGEIIAAFTDAERNKKNDSILLSVYKNFYSKQNEFNDSSALSKFKYAFSDDIKTKGQHDTNDSTPDTSDIDWN